VSVVCVDPEDHDRAKSTGHDGAKISRKALGEPSNVGSHETDCMAPGCAPLRATSVAVRAFRLRIASADDLGGGGQADHDR
jgi:hypothetical protein